MMFCWEWLGSGTHPPPKHTPKDGGLFVEPHAQGRFCGRRSESGRTDEDEAKLATSQRPSGRKEASQRVSSFDAGSGGDHRAGVVSQLIYEPVLLLFFEFLKLRDASVPPTIPAASYSDI
jgi:hypothetical protein